LAPFIPLPKMSETRYRFQPEAQRLCCLREMTLINPLWMFTHTNEFWKRRFSATDPASALELTSKTRSPARSAHPLLFTFMFLPFGS
jgi:hypothetical protein